MGVSMVNIGEETIVDLTKDTVNQNNLLNGKTAHGADGELVEGIIPVKTGRPDATNVSKIGNYLSLTAPIGYYNGTIPVECTIETAQKLIGGSVKSGSFTATSKAEYNIEIGFVPSFLIFRSKIKNNTSQYWIYDSLQSTTKYSLNNNSFGYTLGSTVGTYGGFSKVGSTVTWINGNGTNYEGVTVNWIAV